MMCVCVCDLQTYDYFKAFMLDEWEVHSYVINYFKLLPTQNFKLHIESDLFSYHHFSIQYMLHLG